ncbi:Nn.00g058980.m01.CDS01 [Neocucurbitaria sp. VM-36]
MSLRYYNNHYSGLPRTKVLLYHSSELDPKALTALNIFSSLNKRSNHVLITDSTVAELYLARLLTCFSGLQMRIHPIVINPGELTKSIQTYVKLLGQCAALGLDRESSVISFGGGVVKDLAGFLASTLYRGLNLVHIPTTLLAQVDAAVDCNQSINLPTGKNLVGTWYSPSEIWINTAFLQSLDERWIRDGLSESIKIALCHSPDFLDLLDEAAVSDSDWLGRVVATSVSLKTETLKGESETEDAIKQYGHTIGHAIEHLSAGTLGHGESIAIGMCVNAEIGLLAGLSDSMTLEKHYKIFQRLALPTVIPEYQDPSQVLAQIRFDKFFLKGGMYAPTLNCLGAFAHSETGSPMIQFSEDLILLALKRNSTRRQRKKNACKL